jgi:hypothetical protein
VILRGQFRKEPHKQDASERAVRQFPLKSRWKQPGQTGKEADGFARIRQYDEIGKNPEKAL